MSRLVFDRRIFIFFIFLCKYLVKPPNPHGFLAVAENLRQKCDSAKATFLNALHRRNSLCRHAVLQSQQQLSGWICTRLSDVMSAIEFKESVDFELCCMLLSIAQLCQRVLIAIAVQAPHCVRNTGGDLRCIRAANSVVSPAAPHQ